MQPIIIIILIIICVCSVCVSLSSTGGGIGWYMTMTSRLYRKFIYNRNYGTEGDITVVSGKDFGDCANKCAKIPECNAIEFSFKSAGDGTGNYKNGKCALKKLTLDSKYTTPAMFTTSSKDYLGDDLLIKQT